MRPALQSRQRTSPRERKLHIEMRSLDEILAVARCELRTNTKITVYTFDDGVEHRRAVELPQQATGWQRARQKARRKGVRRAWRVLAVWPVALLLAWAFIGYAWGPHEDSSWTNAFENPIRIWSERTVGCFFAVGAVVVAIVATVGDLSAFGGDPIVRRGEVVGKTESGEASALEAVFRTLFGYDLVVNVKQAVRIGHNQCRGEQVLLGDQMKVQSTRRIHHQMKLNEDVFLICNPGGRAVATLSDLHDEVAAEELRAVLDTAAAPEPAPVPKPAAAPEPESLKPDGQGQG
jgi:hypothetical protein